MIKFLHFPKEGVTLGYEIVNENKELEIVDVKVASAATAPKDQFSRKIGRDIVVGRINSDRPGIKHVDVFKLSGKLPETGKEWQGFEKNLIATIEAHDNVILR